MMITAKGAARSKTVWLGLGLAVFGFLQTQDDVLGQFVSDKTMGLIDMGFGLAVVILRFITTESLAEKGNDTGSS